MTRTVMATALPWRCCSANYDTVNMIFDMLHSTGCCGSLESKYRPSPPNRRTPLQENIDYYLVPAWLSARACVMSLALNTCMCVCANMEASIDRTHVLFDCCELHAIHTIRSSRSQRNNARYSSLQATGKYSIPPSLSPSLPPFLPPSLPPPPSSGVPTG